MHYEDVQVANDSFQCCQMTFATSDENGLEIADSSCPHQY